MREMFAAWLELSWFTLTILCCENITTRTEHFPPTPETGGETPTPDAQFSGNAGTWPQAWWTWADDVRCHEAPAHRQRPGAHTESAQGLDGGERTGAVDAKRWPGITSPIQITMVGKLGIKYCPTATLWCLWIEASDLGFTWYYVWGLRPWLYVYRLQHSIFVAFIFQHFVGSYLVFFGVHVNLSISSRMHFVRFGRLGDAGFSHLLCPVEKSFR